MNGESDEEDEDERGVTENDFDEDVRFPDEDIEFDVSPPAEIITGATVLSWLAAARDHGYASIGGQVGHGLQVGRTHSQIGLGRAGARVGHAEGQVGRSDGQVGRGEVQVGRGEVQLGRPGVIVARAGGQVERDTQLGRDYQQTPGENHPQGQEEPDSR